MRHVYRFLLCLLGTFATAAVGGYGSAMAKGFYASLQRPAWAPPAWLFGPVWTCLYLMIAVAAFLAWSSGRAGRRELGVFVAQLALNALWPWIYFVWGSGLWSFIEIVALWALIATNVALFWRCSRAAGMLLLPYLLWVSFATALTWATWRLNPGVL